MRKLKFALSLVAMLMMTLVANAWEFKSVTPAQGSVSELKEFVFEFPSDVTSLSNMPSYLYVAGPNGSEAQLTCSTVDGGIKAVLASPITEPGEYSISWGMGFINTVYDQMGMPVSPQTFTWTVGKSGGDNNNAAGYNLTYDGNFLKLTKDGCTSYDTNNAGGATLEGFEGFFSFNPADPEWTFTGNTCIGAYVSLADGTYTLHVQAGTFLFDGVANEAFDITFTVGTPGGGGGNFEWSGTPSHETVFKAGETVVDKTNIVFETEGVKVTTVDGSFDLGGTITTIPFGYNTYDEKELDWNNKCQFVVTAKQDINKVIFVPTASAKNAIANASAQGGEGSYSNGVWEGKLAAGETLTLTASDGIQIKEIYVCYNGDDYDPSEGNVNVKGVITIQYPVENQLIEKQVDGGKFCTFTTNKEYAQVTIEVRNSNPVYDNLYKFPTRMVDNMGEKSDNLHVGENTVTAATPGGGSAGHGDDWYWFKGDSYTMIVRGYVNPWDAAEDYDAIAEVHFVGDGVEHAAESLVKLLNVTPATSNDAPAEIAEVNGIITLEFDNAVQSVEALTPGGQMDPTIYYTASAKDGSDNKVWEINLGDRSGYASADTDGDAIIEINVTAKDADGGVVAFSDDRADRGLTLKYKLVAGSSEPSKVVTLGSPVWSVAEGEDIDASTKSINIKFPSATNVEAGYTLEVSGTIGDKSFNLKTVSGTGTMGAGADIAVSLSEDTGYNLVIGTITVKNGSTVVYSTESANYQLNFGTKSNQGGGDSDILGEPTFTATADGIVVEWPNANVSGINECVIVLGEWTLTHKGVDYTTYPDQLEDFTNGVKVEIPYSKVAAWDDVNYVYVPVEVAPGDEINISIAAEGLQVYANYYSSFDPAIYSNASAITGTVTVPGGQAEAKEVVVYEEGVDVHTDNTEINFAKGGVTFTSTTNGSAYIVNNFKPGCNASTAQHLRVWSYNTLHFSASSDITKIEFVAPTASYKYTLKSVSTGSFADNVWTGSAKDVDIVFGNGNHDIVKVIVTLGGTATAIQNVESVKNATVMYNLAGQRINNAKGIVIMNGKKYMVK